MDKVKAQKHLAQADKIVEEGNARIKRQKERVEELVADGHKTKNAKATLKSLQNLEETMVKYRDLIREELMNSE